MNRRRLLSLLPFSAFGLQAKAEVSRPPLTEEEAERIAEVVISRHLLQEVRLAEKMYPSPWVEITCENPFYNTYTGEWLGVCNTKFKFIRGVRPRCPKCLRDVMLIDKEGGYGIEVKDEPS